MNVLITGCNGFIGGWIVKTLGQGSCIIGCGVEEHPQYSVDKYIKWNIGEEEIPIDFNDLKIDAIVHAAAVIDNNDANMNLIKVNCLGTHRIYQLARHKNVKVVVLIGSIPVIGSPTCISITENTRVNPLTMYHSTKVMQEMILRQLNKLQIRFCSLRIPSPIGPGQKTNTILPIFLRNALSNTDLTLYGKGTRKQNYIDVRDIAFCISLLIKTDSANGIYNLGSDYTISNYELAEKCISLCNSKSKIIFNGLSDLCDDENWIIDSSKIKAEIGYAQKYSIEQSIVDMIGEMKKW